VAGDGQDHICLSDSISWSTRCWNGWTYVACTGTSSSIESIDLDGNVTTVASGSTGLLAVDGGNHVYLLGSSGAQIVQTDGSGSEVAEWGSQGSNEGQFASIGGVAVSRDGNLAYVADTGNDRVMAYAFNLPAMIVSQPSSKATPSGSTLTLGIISQGASPLTYQWALDGQPLPGATNATFTITNAGQTNSGGYTVRVANKFGSAVSSNAVLAVVPAFLTTQAANGISSTNAVFSASVTAGLNDTSVWFEWGVDTTYGDITSVMHLGGGPGAFIVTNLVLSLAPTTVYHYRVVVSNSAGTVTGTDVSFTTEAALGPPLAQTSAPYGNWSSVASSADGTRMMAVDVTGPIYRSTNSGVTWTSSMVPDVGFDLVIGSADGTKWLAVGSRNTYGGQPGAQVFYSSRNSGATWTLSTSPIALVCLACSADGRKLVAGARADASANSESLFTSVNSGASWARTSAPTNSWRSVASSADGIQLVAAAYVDPLDNPGAIFTSPDSGKTWTQSQAPLAFWNTVACSTDGRRLVAGCSEAIWTSTNGGANWTKAALPTDNWQAVASSADGHKLVAAGSNTGIWTSKNSGADWSRHEPFGNSYAAVASSADGEKVVAAVGVAFGGGVSTLQSTPTPTLSITAAAGKAVVSWTIPSTPFVLQQNSDLTTTNWTDVMTPSVLNLTNLENQVILSPANSNGFYRLMH